MKIQNKIIKQFLEDLPPKCKKPLDKIITKMLDESKYIDGSTLIYDENNECEFDKEHYHNWDCNPSEINEIKNIKNNEYNEDNDIKLTTLLSKFSSPNIECVKGDVQIGKRVHACIMMWMSIYIYERPVLYLFRPLNIDKEQLQDDIDGTESWNFNMEWVKKEFNNCMEKESNKKYFDYRLPSLTCIKNPKVANKLSDKEYLSDPKMIYCALMNTTDLETLNKKFYEYILENCEKVNITLIIDESDLLSPTAENSTNISEKDTKNSKSEKLIARLVNKVAHTIHITGTAHSFFWNYTTALSDTNKTHIPVEKVFVMNRPDDYYGFMKKNINFSTNNENVPIISEWWSKCKGDSKEDKYDVIKDYNLNIKNIISSIVKRQNPYNSFLISEEKIQGNQIKLADKIITDFHSLFCVVFHGKKGKNGLPTGLRLYFPKKIDNLDIEKELHQVVISEKRLDKPGGLKGTPTSDNNEEYYDEYKYYDINMKSKEFNIKMVYKVLAMLFKKIKSNKTVITITGKYGERGYSFTSDYYNKDNKYVLHLTDQYFVSHTSFNCTDIFQRGRIQGKYTDNPNLIFWTTSELVEIINEYVDFITKIENKIMSLSRGHEYIRNLCEINLFHKEFIKTLGRLKQRKNLESKCIKYDRKNNAMIYSFTPNLKPENYKEYFSNWCKEQGIEFNGFINRLEILDKENYLEECGIYNIKQKDKQIKFENFDELKEQCNKLIEENKLEFKLPTQKWWDERERQKKSMFYKDRLVNEWKKQELDDYRLNLLKSNIRNDVVNHLWNFAYNNEKLFISLRYTDNKILPKSDLNILQKQNYKEIDNNKILYSNLNYKYINDSFLEHDFEGDELTEQDEFPLDKEDIKTINKNPYFFLTADGYVYHHDPEKSIKKVRIQIKSEIEQSRNSELINPILTFKEGCIKEIEGSNRVGVKKVMEVFNTWCKKNGVKKYKSLKDFREKFEEITGLKRSKTNIKGYKIELKI
jgi:hypothetical protein